MVQHQRGRLCVLQFTKKCQGSTMNVYVLKTLPSAQ